jgi:hypothetical protein
MVAAKKKKNKSKYKKTTSKKLKSKRLSKSKKKKQQPPKGISALNPIQKKIVFLVIFILCAGISVYHLNQRVNEMSKFIPVSDEITNLMVINSIYEMG